MIISLWTSMEVQTWIGTSSSTWWKYHKKHYVFSLSDLSALELGDVLALFIIHQERNLLVQVLALLHRHHFTHGFLGGKYNFWKKKSNFCHMEVKIVKTRKKMQKWPKLTKKCHNLWLTLIVIISGYKQYFLDLSKGRNKSFCSQAVAKRPGTWVISSNRSRVTAV